jgi:hypothetical protein
VKNKRLKKKELPKRGKRLTSTKSDSSKSAEEAANMTDDELLARARAEARGRATQPEDPGIPPSLDVTFAYGYASSVGFVDCDPDGQCPWIQEYGQLKRAEGELLESFRHRIRDTEPIGKTEPSLCVYSGVNVNFDAVQKVRVMGKLWERIPGESWSAFEQRFAGAANTPRQKAIIARGTINERSEAFQNRPGEDEKAFLGRLRERFGQDVKFSTLSWPAAEQCPYVGPAQKVKETAERLRE